MQKHSGSFMLGNQFTLLDILWMPLFQRLELLDMKLWEENSGVVNLNKWWSTVKQRSIFENSFT